MHIVKISLLETKIWYLDFKRALFLKKPYKEKASLKYGFYRYFYDSHCVIQLIKILKGHSFKVLLVDLSILRTSFKVFSEHKNASQDLSKKMGGFSFIYFKHSLLGYMPLSHYKFKSVVLIFFMCSLSGFVWSNFQLQSKAIQKSVLLSENQIKRDTPNKSHEVIRSVFEAMQLNQIPIQSLEVYPNKVRLFSDFLMVNQPLFEKVLRMIQEQNKLSDSCCKMMRTYFEVYL